MCKPIHMDAVELIGNIDDDFGYFQRFIQETPYKLNRERRSRMNVLRTVFNECISQGKQANYCLYLANLYQSAKGFHGF